MEVMGLGNVKDNASNISRDQNRRNTTEKIKNYYKCAAISHLTDEGSSPALYPVLRDTYTYPLTVLLKESFKQTKSLQGRFSAGPTNSAQLEKFADHHSS